MPIRPIIFGEALFDLFPDGHRVLGGAPFNVAWHLQGFGVPSRFVSRVGNDDLGHEILQRMEAWGLSTRDIQLDDRHPTGRVRVSLSGGNPSFDIEADQAYDYIEAPAEPPNGDGDAASLLYHGSLAIRGAQSWTALDQLGVPAGGVVCDLNLRPPWWSRDRVNWCLRRASWIKINESELHILTEESTNSTPECLDAARSLSRRFAIQNLIVTRGARGALGLFDGAEAEWQNPSEITHLVDTVGAGDAFSAMLILGILREWHPRRLLERASDFAAEICTIRGATTSDRSVYERHVETA